MPTPCARSGPSLTGLFHPQLVHISPVNNAPQIGTGTYTPPSSCGTAAPDDECFFGQYFTPEDSAALVSIAGVAVDDPDLYELCDYTAPTCKSIDVTVRADLGSVSLNTRSNLVLYVSDRNQQVRALCAFCSSSASSSSRPPSNSL